MVVGPDLVGVHVVLGEAEDARGGLGDPDNVLDYVVGSLVEVALEVARDGAQEVFLEAEGDLVGADHNDHEDCVGLSDGVSDVHAWSGGLGHGGRGRGIDTGLWI